MTYERYHEIVVHQIAERTGWSLDEASNAVGDIRDMMDDEELSPDEAAQELFAVLVEDAEPTE